MTDTPARDELVRDALVSGDLMTPSERSGVRWGIYYALNNPSKVIAALVEAHGLDEVLRALGGVASTEEPECLEWPLDLGQCAYFRRGQQGVDPNGTCSFGCQEEPECMTCHPQEGWPSERGAPPEPWRWCVDLPAEVSVERVWVFPSKEATGE